MILLIAYVDMKNVVPLMIAAFGHSLGAYFPNEDKPEGRAACEAELRWRCVGIVSSMFLMMT